MGFIKEYASEILDLKLNLRGKDLLELGAQICSDDSIGERNSLLKKTGFFSPKSYTIYDTADQPEAIQFDFSVPHEALDKFDIITNFGTVQNVKPKPAQYQCWKNMHEMCRVGGYIINVVPVFEGSGEGKNHYCYKRSFFEEFRKIGYWIESSSVTNDLNMFIVLRKYRDMAFVSEGTFWENDRLAYKPDVKMAMVDAIDLRKIDLNRDTELCALMNGFGSDKGNGHHNYTKVYDHLFKDMRNSAKNIFELGLGTNNPNMPSSMGVHGKPGASLRGWARYFKNAQISGADIDSAILFKEDRITTFWCDQKNPQAISDMWSKNELSRVLFDVIIEDGLHEFDANITFFENSIHKLLPGGYYIIEDIVRTRLEKYENYFRNSPHKENHIILDVPNPRNRGDNIIAVIVNR